MLSIIQNRKIYFIISGLLCLISILSLAFWGLRLAIDFTGGTLMEIEFTQKRPENQQIEKAIKDLNLGSINIRESGEKSIILRMKTIDEKQHQEILKRLSGLRIQKADKEKTKAKEVATLTELRFESIGPIIGQELKRKTLWAISLVVIAIIFYVAWAFRKVSKISYISGVASWKYGLGAIIALIHDILIVTGIFSILGRFANIEIDILFITALLTILGYSVNDTIVVYDRIRENLMRLSHQDFETVVNQSINETIVRSLNTSLTTLLVLLAVFFFGGVTIKYFVLALIFGIVLGTYSSIFIASPLLVAWEKIKR